MNKTNKPMGLDEHIAHIRLNKKQYWPFKERPEIKGFSTLYYYDADLIDDFLNQIKSEALKIFKKALGEDELVRNAKDDLMFLYRNELRQEAKEAFKKEIEKW